MRIANTRPLVFRVSFLALTILAGCVRRGVEPADHPRLAAGTVVRDVSFSSRALGREMTYRVILPAAVSTKRQLATVYLLHGGGGHYRDWSNYTEVAQFARSGFVLVMPEGDYSYYTNAVNPPGNRYEDYIVDDLIADVEARFPVVRARSRRAIVGVSMGGFGAVKIALDHPERVAFTAALSPAIDAARRPFSLRRVKQYRAMEGIFGPWGSTQRMERDPFRAASSALAGATPFLYLSCGEEDGLLPSNRSFVAALQTKGLQHEFHVVPGGHDWVHWARQVQAVFAALAAHVQTGDNGPAGSSN
ncbi:alpha/beta hydrolase family protein [uncultured Paludibaculum sp.]|uniref:alpha/beta hydrolase n=1 Tax=uncultured Paludibaculum sp. TaxID=1765020 RepID=UPI002AAA8B7E|nr:alpha/beta hydrolase family protein [uncultured Paludibaculum sp.]